MSSLQKALAKEAPLRSSLQNAVVNEKGYQDRPPPSVSTAYESSTDGDDSTVDTNEQKQQPIKNFEDLMKIRTQAINLVNTPSSGPQAEANRKKYGQQRFPSPYQQQSAGEHPASSGGGTFNNISSYQSSAPNSMHDPLSHPPAKMAEKLSMTDMVVNCVSEVCKSSSSEILSKVLHSGYKSLNNYENAPVTGTWNDLDTSQHGYGNGNKAPTQNNGTRIGGYTKYQD